MPLYEYACDACGKRFEVIRKFSDPELETCTQCGKGPVHRLLSSPAIQFKGTGWYITDYSAKGKSSSEASNAKGETKTESGSADAAGKSDKSDSKPAAAPSKPSSSET